MLVNIVNIDEELPTAVIAVSAGALGFRVNYDRTEGADRWTLSAGHGDTHVQYVGTRRNITAFLQGYSAMKVRATRVLSQTSQEIHTTIEVMRGRLDG